MKSYTDIEQSRTLAKILSHDTADQTWERIAISSVAPESLQYSHDGNTPFTYYSGIGVPCWSLAALLGIIPDVSLNSFKDEDWNVMVQHDGKMIYTDKDNPVDACVELILKMYEQKLIF